MAKRRTDPHRKGAIIPAEYEHVLSYNLSTTQDGWPMPSFGINCELDRRIYEYDEHGHRGKLLKNGEHDPDGRCCVVGLAHVAKVKWAEHGNTGKCTACGASFIYGEVWKHIPTGEHIHLGNICGENYGLMVDRSAFELEAGRRRAAEAAHIQRELNRERRQAILAANPGLEEALGMDHYILQDLDRKFHIYHNLSQPQIDLALKIMNEIKNPKPEEVKVPAPLGKQVFQGKVISTKTVDSIYGSQLKMLVRVDTEGGHWTVWGTVPANILRETADKGCFVRGCRVEIKATLAPSQDEHFVYMSRPSGKVLDFTEEGDNN